MSIDAACTACCCTPTGPCCACPGTEVRIRINNVSRRLIVANQSVVLYDHLETFQADIKFRILPSSTCYSTATFLPAQDLGSSWSLAYRFKKSEFPGQQQSCAIHGSGSQSGDVDSPPNCKPCLTPEVKVDDAENLSGSFGFPNTYTVQCVTENCPCTLTEAGRFWRIAMQCGGRYANLYGSALNCLSSNTFNNSFLEYARVGSLPDTNLDAPCLVDIQDVPRECRSEDGLFGLIYPTGIRCVVPTGGDVGPPSVYLQGSGSLASRKLLGCAKYLCQQFPPLITLYKCRCRELQEDGSINNAGLFPFQVFVSQQLSVSSI